MDERSQLKDQEHLDDAVLNEYLDGYLSATDTAYVERHLSACPACAAHCNELQNLFISLQDLDDEILERDLSSEIMKAIQPKLQIPKIIRWGTFPQLAIALFLFWGILPDHVRSWAALIPQLIQHSSEFAIFEQLSQKPNWLSSIHFSLPEWYFPAIQFDLQAIQIIHWPVIIVSLIVLMILNTILLRQVVRNGSK